LWVLSVIALAMFLVCLILAMRSAARQVRGSIAKAAEPRP
jgi:hypothetical protein